MEPEGKRPQYHASTRPNVITLSMPFSRTTRRTGVSGFRLTTFEMTESFMYPASVMAVLLAQITFDMVIPDILSG